MRGDETLGSLQTRRRAGRAREAARPVVQAGMPGGRYRPLTGIDEARVHEAAVGLLEQIGMADPVPRLRDAAMAAGCRLSSAGRLCFPRALVEDVIARTPKQVHYLGRDPRHDLELSGVRVNTFGGGDAVSMLDVGASRYRPSTLLDVYDMARLVDRLEHVHAFSRLVVATEFEDQLACDLNTAYASAAGTVKHTALAFHRAENIQPTLEMLWMIAGGERKFRERPFMHGGGCAVISPLRYGSGNSEVCLEATRFGAPVWIVVAPQAGTTAPAALAGVLVQAVAEALAGLLLVDLVFPRHPIVVGCWPFVSDLRRGTFSGGSGEEALVSAAAVQMMAHYGLATSVGAGMTDAKVPDNQAGYEKGIAVALAVHAGCNNVSESAGMVGSLMAGSLEALVIDNDMLGAALRTVRGIEINDETLSQDVIERVVFGDGHFMRHPQTLKLMRSEYIYPDLADRSAPDDWVTAGSRDIREQAALRVRSMLAEHYPDYIDPVIDRRVRERFPIRLDRSDMRPGNERWPRVPHTGADA